MKDFRPHARSARLVIQELPDELLVYDTDRYQAHCLNQLAAAIWKQCDGETTPAEIAARVEGLLGTPVTEDAVWHALYQLTDFGLLQDEGAAVAAAANVTRRELMVRLSLIAGLTVPLVTSIVAPAAAQTGSGPTGPTGLPNF